VTTIADPSAAADARRDIDGAYAWRRLAVSVLLCTVGGVGMWSVVVVLPTVQAEFGADRAGASLPYTFTMLGFAFGGVWAGRLADRFGIVVPLIGGALALGAGYLLTAIAPTLWLFAILHGLLIGLGSSASFSPLIADISHWFVRRRGLAVAICAAGNYVAGAFWPTVVQHFVSTSGWRATHIGIGLFCMAGMLPLVWLMRRRPPGQGSAAFAELPDARHGSLGLSPGALQWILSVAGFACCVAMSMPQVHLVAYCGDLGYGVARGAEMLSIMLAAGIISRVASGFIADRIGGVGTLLLGSTLQAVALMLYLSFNGLSSLYVISALFGLFQGGIVPSYALIVREYFSPSEAGTRLGLIIMATLFGMAFGGWMSGLIFDLTGSYRVAFANGVVWNLLNISVALWLLSRGRQRLAPA
jgi:MFS family permease